MSAARAVGGGTDEVEAETEAETGTAAEAAADAIVVGAGWAGLTAALRLAEAGMRVVVVDAAPQAGGRGRGQTIDWTDPVSGRAAPITVDNGQHLLIGAYVETLGLLERLGALTDRTAARRPMRLADAAGLDLARRRFVRDGPGEAGSHPLAPGLEALSPLFALAGARGLAATSRWALVRTLAGARLRGWRPPPGVRTVADWLRATRQPDELARLLWQPLVVSTMNTPADDACAATFLRVLRDSLGGPPSASDFVLPRGSLDAFFVEPVLRALAARGVRLLLRRDVRRIEAGASRRYRLVTANRVATTQVGADPGPDAVPDACPAPASASATAAGALPALEADRIVLATPPAAAARLLRDLADPDLLERLNRFRYLPITTAWVGWSIAGAEAEAWIGAGTDRQPGPFAAFADTPVLALRADPARGWHAHWLFDRGRQSGWRIASLVISDSRAARELGSDGLAEALIGQLAGELRLPRPEQLTLIHEKRATFACTPDRPRLAADAAASRLPGLALAGDYAWPDYPATLEGAVRSGIAAAALLAGSRAA